MSEKSLIPPDTRPRFTFTVPEEERMFPNDPKAVTLVPIRMSDEIEALRISEAAGTGMAGYLNEVVRRAVVAVNGQPVNWDGSGAEWMELCSPPVRSLVKGAFNKIHTPKDGTGKAFLDSMRVESA